MSTAPTAAHRRARTGWRYVGLAVLGAALGVIGARFVFVGSGLSLIPWGLVAIVVGVLAPTRGAALADAAAYGFTLALTFMVAGYDGTATLVSRLPSFVILGLIGAGCAALLALIGSFVATAIRRQSLTRTTSLSDRKQV